MHESFQQITIHPPLPCVYHDCDGQATVAIAYAVSDYEFSMVANCEQHTVPIPGRNERLSEPPRREEAIAVPW